MQAASTNHDTLKTHSYRFQAATLVIDNACSVGAMVIA